MSFWMRSSTLQVGSNVYDLDDFAFEFEVPFEDSEQLMTTKITIYNLAEGTRNSIKKHDPVIINAGYQGDIGVIFQGNISNHLSKHNGTEWTTEITATEIMREWLSAKVNKTYNKGITAEKIIKDQLGIFGVEVGKLELAVNKTYPRGRVCDGPVRDILRDIVTSDCKSIFMVRHGQVYIRRPDTGIDMAVLLSPASGLLFDDKEDQDTTEITAPQDTQKSREQRASESRYIKRKCLLNYRIAPGDVIRIRDSTLNGNFIVKKGSHKGSRKSDWVSHLEVIPA